MDVTDPRTSTQGEPRNFPRRPGVLGVPYFGSPHRPFPPVLRRLGDGQQSPLELRSGSILPCGRVEFTCHFTEPMTCKGVLQRRFFFWLSLLEMTEGQRSFSVARACLVSGGVQAELGQHVGSTCPATNDQGTGQGAGTAPGQAEGLPFHDHTHLPPRNGHGQYQSVYVQVLDVSF